MKIILKMRTALFFVLIITGFSSCIDLETEPVFFSDAFIVSRLVDGDTLYAVDAQVQCSVPMKSVLMNCDKNEDEFQLYPLFTDSMLFEYTTTIQNYKAQVPGQGYYNFQITLSDKSTHSHFDIINSRFLKPFSVDTIFYYPGEMSTTFDWPAVLGANYYYARVLKNDSILFNSGWINSEFTSIRLTANSLGWYSAYTPKEGDSLQFVVLAVLAEDHMYNNMLEIQSVAFSSNYGFVWGK
jgi:hypothetical protein